VNLLYIVISIIFLVSALSWRKKIPGCSVLETADKAGPDDHIVLTAKSIELNDAHRNAALKHAAESGLDLIDLIPVDLPAQQIFHFQEFTARKTTAKTESRRR